MQKLLMEIKLLQNIVPPSIQIDPQSRYFHKKSASVHYISFSLAVTLFFTKLSNAMIPYTFAMRADHECLTSKKNAKSCSDDTDNEWFSWVESA